jgi:hypothetical protein
MSGAIPLLPHYAFMAWIGTTFLTLKGRELHNLFHVCMYARRYELFFDDANSICVEKLSKTTKIFSQDIGNA